MQSDTVKRGFKRAPRGRLFKATGALRSDGNAETPFFGGCTRYDEQIPRHVYLHEAGQVVREAAGEAGGVPFALYTVGAADPLHSANRYHPL